MKRIKNIIIMTMLLSCPVIGQDLQNFLLQVSNSNPGIIAYGKLLEARRYEAGTGNAPADPVISLGYMPEQTAGEGVKKTWSVTQSFSFPTKYITQSRLKKEKIVLAEQEFDMAKIDILLNTEYLVFDYIFNKRKLELLEKRKELYERLKSAWKKMLDSGGTTILDYNRIVFGISSLNLQISVTRSDLSVINQKLLYLSGGIQVIPEFSDYPGFPEILSDEIIAAKKASHPAFLLPEIEFSISENALKLARSASLPEFQAGYASEIVPGETYTGPVAGMTIPLWANTGKIRTANAMSAHMAALRDAKIAELSASVRGESEKLRAISESISDLRSIAESGNNIQNLDKALSAGEISLTDYFLYLESSFETEDKLLELENSFNKTAASLYDQDLLKLSPR